MIAFHNQRGRAIAYIAEDGASIYLFRGTPVAYIANGKLYAYSGRFLGWFENGWFYDRDNRPALFSARASGGPLKPLRALKPLRGIRSIRPIRGVRELTPLRATRSLAWSDLSGSEYFEQ